VNEALLVPSDIGCSEIHLTYVVPVLLKLFASSTLANNYTHNLDRDRLKTKCYDRDARQSYISSITNICQFTDDTIVFKRRKLFYV